MDHCLNCMHNLHIKLIHVWRRETQFNHTYDNDDPFSKRTCRTRNSDGLGLVWSPYICRSISVIHSLFYEAKKKNVHKTNIFKRRWLMEWFIDSFVFILLFYWRKTYRLLIGKSLANNSKTLFCALGLSACVKRSISDGGIRNWKETSNDISFYINRTKKKWMQDWFIQSIIIPLSALYRLA